MPEDRKLNRTLARLLKIRPHNDETLWRYISLYANVRIPRTTIKTRRECSRHCPPFKWLADMFFDRVDDCLAWACRSGGKSYNAGMVCALEHAFKPGLDSRILGGSQEQSKRVYEHFQPIVEGPLHWSVDGLVQRELTRFQGGGRCQILAASPTNVLGHHVARLYLDEVDEFEPDLLEKAMGTSQSQKGRDGALYRSRVAELSTFHNPYGLMAKELDRAEDEEIPTYTWCIFEVLERCSDDYQCKGCNLWEDCQGVAKRECDGYVTIEDARKWKKRHSRLMWEAFYLCKRPWGGDLFYPEFNPEVHILPTRREFQPNMPLYLSLDWGGNPPTRCLFIQTDGTAENENVYVLEDLQTDSPAASLQAKQVKRHIAERYKVGQNPARIEACTCDPSGKSYRAEFQLQGLECFGKSETGRRLNIRKMGQEVVRQRLKDGEGRAHLFFNPGVKAAEELAGLHYPDVREGQPPPDDHAKVDDHGADALRYFLAWRFPQNPWQFQE